MNLVIQGSKNFNVSDKIKAFIKKRSEKLHYFKNHINEMNFHLDHEKHLYKVDVTMSLKKHGVHKFELSDTEMYTAIDKIIHKIDIKINREKSKIQDHNKANHEDVVEFFYEHEKDTPEPTAIIKVDTKPTSLTDGLLMLKDLQKDFLGFYLLETNSIAFLRKAGDDLYTLIKSKAQNKFGEYKLIEKGSSITVDQEIREVDLPVFNLLNAQKDILNQDYFYDLFIDSATNEVSLLYKENNGKWVLLK